MPEPVLSIQGLSKHPGGLAAVSDVSLDLDLRQVYAVIGAGKTTLINLLSRELAASGGSIRYRERDIAGLSADQIARLGIARSYQRTNVFAEFNGRVLASGAPDAIRANKAVQEAYIGEVAE